jgi:short-subunit dehydrogenase
MARYLSKLGYDLIIVAQREERLIELKEELKTNVQVISMDLSIKENCINLYKSIKNQEIDLLINNAGFGEFGTFNETDLEKEIKLINTNIAAVHILTKLFLKDMKKVNKGRILNVASVAGFAPGPLMAAYYSSKAYVLRLSQAIYTELKKDKSNVHISVLCPGPIATEFNDVAGVKFTLKPLSSEYVAKYAIDKTLKNKPMIIPGLLNKMMIMLTKVAPSKLTARIVYRNQKKKR